MADAARWLRKKSLVLFFGGITGERTWVSLIRKRKETFDHTACGSASGRLGHCGSTGRCMDGLAKWKLVDLMTKLILTSFVATTFIFKGFMKPLSSSSRRSSLTMPNVDFIKDFIIMSTHRNELDYSNRLAQLISSIKETQGHRRWVIPQHAVRW